MHVITRGRFDLVPRYVLTEPGTFWPGDVGTRWRFDIDPHIRQPVFHGWGLTSRFVIWLAWVLWALKATQDVIGLTLWPNWFLCNTFCDVNITLHLVAGPGETTAQFIKPPQVCITDCDHVSNDQAQWRQPVFTSTTLSYENDRSPCSFIDKRWHDISNSRRPARIVRVKDV